MFSLLNELELVPVDDTRLKIKVQELYLSLELRLEELDTIGQEIIIAYKN